MSLREAAMVGFVGVSDAERARQFYQDVLGLRLVSSELPFALVFDANGAMLRVTMVDKVQAPPYTTLGWNVSDIAGTVKQLTLSGVGFERYKGLNDGDEYGIWQSPGGAQIAWFRDPDGNLLSVAQHSR